MRKPLLFAPCLPIFAFCLSTFALKGQPGCTDPLANNFSLSATSNDGSCQYAATFLSPQKVANLPLILEETSGLIFAADKCWTHNDGGPLHSLFAIDTTDGTIIQTVDIQGLANNDWEEITTDGQHLFIGDFGNNGSGNRTDLAIFSLDLSLIGNLPNVQIPVSSLEKIEFSFPDQTDFATQPANSTAFDCEAFFWKNGRLHLFSKNWLTLTTAHYSLDPTTGICEKLEIFSSKSGLITASTLAADGKTIALLGYDLSNFTVFAWLLFDWSGDLFFSGNRRKIDLGSVVVLGQTEALAFVGPTGFRAFLTNEKVSQFLTIAPQLWSVGFDDLLPKTTGLLAEKELPELAISPNPFSQQLDFQLIGDEKSAAVRLFDGLGRVVFSAEISGDRRLETGHLPAGFYRLEAVFEAGVFSKKLLKIGPF